MGAVILVLDDDKDITNLLRIYLEMEHYEVHLAHDGEEGLKILSNIPADLIILDVMMPKKDGIVVCREIRQGNQTVPILMLSAKAEDMDKIYGLAMGADDYLVKPFNPLELIARVKALLRRSGFSQSTSGISQEGLHVGPLEINKQKHTVSIAGIPLSLTAIEFDILCLLCSKPGRVFSSEDIFQLVWNEQEIYQSKTVMVHISNLRAKLDKALNGEKMIVTVWGVGYKIDY
ncbi:response regulator transcription factor [Sporosarcina limicola]|uniref:DNA-binding response OmpR family regulator n=1 Tax=Sporosarcina limicola TaxID=34101 RepID=A0A927ML55_9BACL|nr:response regulator transcription factor [Sporosarcina limicola]MBE1555958.1 DNA-binding response OmpR family regulator [Sporosarcina limicola]